METKKIQLEILERLRCYINTFDIEVQIDNFIKDNNLKPIIEVGKYYKVNGEQTLFYVAEINDKSLYKIWGFSRNGFWQLIENCDIHSEHCEEATKQEWQSRLEQYAETLGYNHEEPNYKCLYEETNTKNGIVESYFIDSRGFGVRLGLDYYNILMKNGVWAKTFEKSDKEKIKELEQRINQLELTIKKK